jgi:hypothetical protein
MKLADHLSGTIGGGCVFLLLPYFIKAESRKGVLEEVSKHKKIEIYREYETIVI